jgi:predicted nucleic-acid-binding protein
MRAVDTNVLVRLVVGDDAKQVALAEDYIRRGAWASHLVLAELTWVLRVVYRFDSARIASVVDMFLNHDTIAIQDADVVEAALDHFRRRPSLGFSDCLILEIAQKAGHLPLGTFDKTLAKLDGAERL